MSDMLERYDHAWGLEPAESGAYVRYSDVEEHVKVQLAAFELFSALANFLSIIADIQENPDVDDLTREANALWIMGRSCAWLRGPDA